MKRVGIFILMALMVTAFCSCSKQKEEGNFEHVADDDAAMNAAIAKAKATSPDFIAAFHAQKPGTSHYCVKKPYPTPKGGDEHMWIDLLTETNGVLEGTIENDAEETREVKIGQKVKLRIDEISDWMYEDGNRLIGGYTIRYFVDKMSPKERENFLKNVGFEL
jgi:uncharacterized protein YegJ (DUF2314 family)